MTGARILPILFTFGLVAVMQSGMLAAEETRPMGELVMWGNSFDYSNEPWWVGGSLYDLPSGTNFVACAGGNDHKVALRADGSLVSWGNNRSECETPAALLAARRNAWAHQASTLEPNPDALQAGRLVNCCLNL